MGRRRFCWIQGGDAFSPVTYYYRAGFAASNSPASISLTASLSTIFTNATGTITEESDGGGDLLINSKSQIAFDLSINSAPSFGGAFYFQDGTLASIAPESSITFEAVLDGLTVSTTSISSEQKAEILLEISTSPVFLLTGRVFYDICEVPFVNFPSSDGFTGTFTLSPS
jgi:hypothetical protein